MIGAYGYKRCVLFSIPCYQQQSTWLLKLLLHCVRKKEVQRCPTGCKARITLNENNDLISPTPDQNHESKVAKTHVQVVKQDFKRKAATSDLPT